MSQVKNEHKISPRIVEIAKAIRQRYEEYFGGDLEMLNNTCHKMSESLCDALIDAGFKAIRVPGRYLAADVGYEPDMNQWDEEAIDNFNSEDGFSHWWIEVEGFIVDICADQFHPIDRKNYAIQIESLGSRSYDACY